MIPEIVEVQLTGLCDMKCPMCWGAAYDLEGRLISAEAEITKEQELTTDKWKAIFDELLELGVKTINISGGEPLIRPDSVELIKYASDIGLNVYLSTNLTFQHRLSKVLPYISVLGISLDGSNTEVNQEVGRQPYFFDRTIVFLQSVLSGEINLAKAQLKLGTVVSSRNLKDILEIAKFLQSSGIIKVIDTWRLFQFTPLSRGEANQQDLQISDEQYHAIVAQIMNLNLNTNISQYPSSQADGAYVIIQPHGEVVRPVSSATGELRYEKLGNHREIELAINLEIDQIRKIRAHREWIYTTEQ